MNLRKNKHTKKIWVDFAEGEPLENKNYKLNYKKGDIVFIKKDASGVLQMKEYHTYNSLMKYLENLTYKDENNINKSLLINKFTNIFNLKKRYNSNENEKEILDNIEKNIEFIKNSLIKTFDFMNFDGIINDKLIIGFGNHSVFETDITLHHIYGIPYIPGSALKGVLRNFIIQEYFMECSDICKKECNGQCQRNANNDELFIKIFGGKNEKDESLQGNTIFMDSFPNKKFTIEREVMTPHHQEYYDGSEKLPLDRDRTTPINFLTVAGNDIEFVINIGLNKIINNKVIKKDITSNDKILNKYEHQTIRKFILENLIDALEFHGIGAKTSVGYGYFDINSFDINSNETIKKDK